MTPETKSVLYIGFSSVIFTSAIIGLITTGLYLYTGELLGNLAITTGVILGIGYLFNLFTIQRFNRFLIAKEAEVVKEQQKILFDIECCECGKSHSIPIDFTRDMAFKCEECGIDNKVLYVLKTGRPTEVPLDTNILSLIEKYADNPST